MNYLFEKTRDILTNTGDFILARNKLVASYIKESETSITHSANDFSTQHEERLIEGTCSPRAAPLYLGILDAFKGIVMRMYVSGQLAKPKFEPFTRRVGRDETGITEIAPDYSRYDD